MMAELKTKKNNASVEDFISKIEDPTKVNDCKELVRIFTEVTWYNPSIWWDSIIWFGSYHYKSDRSTQEGDWPLTGFSPRKLTISIYIMTWFNDYADLLDTLGKHKISKWSCLYIKKLSDINIDVLKELIQSSIECMKKIYNV